MTYDDSIELASNAWGEGDFDSALSYAQIALEFKPHDVGAQLIIAVIYSDGYGDFETALDYANDALSDCVACEELDELLGFIAYVEGQMIGVETDYDNDGVPDSIDNCPTTHGTMDGCPDEMPTMMPSTGDLSVEVTDTFYEFISYMVRGSVSDRSGNVSDLQVEVALVDNDGNEVTSVTTTTKSDGSYWTTVGAGSFPGPHVLTVTNGQNQVTKTINIIPLAGQQPICQPTSEYVIDSVDINAPINDANCFKMRYGDKVTHDGSVKYGEEIQFLAKSLRYAYPDRALIEIYNPCGKLVYEAPQQIATDSSFWPKVTPSGSGFNLSGVYEFVSYHEKTGREILRTTFTVQAGGDHVNGPDHPECITSIPGTSGDGGSGKWSGVLTGYGDFYYDSTYHYIYSIEGSFFFDILDDGSIEGDGVSSMHISKTWGLVDNYGYTYSCWSRDNEFDRKSAAYTVDGFIENDKAHLWLFDGSPEDWVLLIWCDLPGFHQDFHPVYNPFKYGSDNNPVFDLKKGSTASTSTKNPFNENNAPGKINWNFEITEEGSLPIKQVEVKPTVVSPPKSIVAPSPTVKETPTKIDVNPTAPPPKPPPQAPVSIPTAPKKPDFPPPPTTTSMKKICEDLGLRYNPTTSKCIAPSPTSTIPIPTIPTPTTPTTPIQTSITFSVDTDRATYNQGNLVTINTDIDGTTSNSNVAVSVTDPSGNVVMTRTLSIDDTGSIPFKILHGTTAGSYKVTASTSINGQNYEDRTQFTIKKDLAGLSIKSVSATDQQGNTVDSFSKGNQGYIKIVLSSDSFVSNSLVTVTVLDSDLIALGTSSIKTSISSDDSEIILSFHIPDDASVGDADIYVNAFTDWPSNGGVPLTKEGSTEIDIGDYT